MKWRELWHTGLCVVLCNFRLNGKVILNLKTVGNLFVIWKTVLNCWVNIVVMLGLIYLLWDLGRDVPENDVMLCLILVGSIMVNA
jgi:hypothetical protein